jgi:diphthamide biosynthesis protein 2
MDDGSRVFLEDSTAAVATTQAQTIVEDLPSYFEIERIASLIQRHAFVAVQFPDTLICYMAKVLELLQDAHPNGLVFGLTGGCCPDLVTAAHLNATALVQYGHACLSQAGQTAIEIIHGFGQKDIDVAACVDVVKSANVRRLLVFYSLEYAHAIEEMQTSLSEQADVLVLVGEIPERRSSATARAASRPCCSSSETGGSSSCCREGAADEATHADDRHVGAVVATELDVVTIGGLIVDRQALETFQDGGYSVLYLGSNENLQFLTIAMRLASRSPPESLFAINLQGQVEPVAGDRASQLLKSRFYLIQKAKLCHVFGILVADVNRDETSIQGTISSVQKLLRDENRVSYTFVVGSLSPAKLANFGEIDCFVLLACPEHSILQHNNTDYHVPVVTPYELLVAFERVPWGTYETQASIDSMLETTNSAGSEKYENDEQTDSDAPFFSLVTGTYQQQQGRFGNRGAALEADDPASLQQLPGKGVLSTYTSAAAEWLQSRDYKGLVVDKNAPVGPATPGRIGIASKYQAR